MKSLNELLDSLDKEINIFEYKQQGVAMSKTGNKATWNKAIDVVFELISISDPLDIDRDLEVSASNVVGRSEDIETIKNSAKKIYRDMIRYLKGLKR